MNNKMTTIKKGFTLIELLVALAIIGLLSGLLIPAVSKARSQGKKIACMSNLRQIGQAIEMYVADNNFYYPVCAFVPSENPEMSRICDVLQPQIKSRKVFYCPADNQGYYELEGSSYQWNSQLNGKPFDRSETYAYPPLVEQRPDMPVMADHGAFHGESGTKGSVNILYTDGVVKSN